MPGTAEKLVGTIQKRVEDVKKAFAKQMAW